MVLARGPRLPRVIHIGPTQRGTAGRCDRQARRGRADVRESCGGAVSISAAERSAASCTDGWLDPGAIAGGSTRGSRARYPQTPRRVLRGDAVRDPPSIVPVIPVGLCPGVLRRDRVAGIRCIDPGLGGLLVRQAHGVVPGGLAGGGLV